jgi:iron complex transport system ATP-binding protein
MEAMEQHIILKAHKLCIGYGHGKSKKVVRDHLELQLRSGEMLCLMGPNGAGKSTLLRTLAGVQPALAGALLIEGRPLQELSQPERARFISLVLTEPVSAGNMTVLELVALGRYPHTGWGGSLTRRDKSLVEEALDELGITALASRKLYELSDGQRQKALVARALAQDGSLIILDEPTAHLDLINRLQIMRLLRQLARKRQKAIIVATHELDLALQSADRLWLLPQQEEGLIEGVPEDLVLNGSLARAFSRSGFHFNTHTGQFVEEINSCVPVQLSGEEPWKRWTRKALERNGYEAVTGQAPLRLEVIRQEAAYSWRLCTPDGEIMAYSIEELLTQLSGRRQNT